MNMDYALIGGLFLVLFSVPATIAAWAEGERLYLRMGVLAFGLLLIEWAYLSDTDNYAPGNWPLVLTQAAARVIP
ncbi:MAG: hypothetical protein QGI08_07185 [Paracoccaceae bacterium]|jgi:hypothetical protein|nr:hypothetical protein [Paracoccaceae bacterium]MDP7185487.1 hypothetical protein [Paracoccaceae bacterium]